MTDAEAREILQAYGAPEDSTDEMTARFINNLAHNHPALFVAVTLYLRQHGWILRDATLNGLFAGEYAGEMNDETVRRLLDTVEDQASHELLYRLNLKLGSFGFDIVQALAAVPPQVERPREKLNALLGLWVQREVSGNLSVSPLIKAVGTSELAPETRKVCYRTLGDCTVKKGDISNWDVANAVLYYSQAEEYNRAGGFLILGLSGMLQQDIRRDPAGLLKLWWDLLLPEQMDLSLRLRIRSLQIAMGHRRGEDLHFMVQNFISLVDQAGPEEALMVFGGAVDTSYIIAGMDYRSACKLILRQVQLAPYFTLANGQQIELPEGINPETFVWFLVAALDTKEKLACWIEMIEQFTPEQRVRAFSGRIADGGCKQLVDHLWMAEADKAPDQRLWDDIVSAFEDLATRARLLGQELLWGAALRGVMVVRSEYQHDLEAIKRLADAEMNTTEDPRARFLLAECLGRNLDYAGQYDQAKDWLHRALECDTETYPYTRVIVLHHMERLVGRDNATQALTYAEEAATIARKSPYDVPVLEVAKIEGELAIARWLAGDKPGAFEVWEEVVSDLIDIKEDTVAWKSTWVAVGHISDYLTSIATMGIPPPETGDGFPYLSPERGMLLQTNRARADHYDSSKDSLIPALMANFAEGVGNDDRAAEWALKAMEVARANGQTIALAAVDRNVVAHLIADDRYAEALDVSLDVAIITVAAMRQHQAGKDPFSNSEDAEAILGKKPNADWQMGENIAAKNALIPAFLRISTLLITHPDLAQQRAGELAGLCRQISNTAADPILWISSAELIDEVFKHPSTAMEIFTRSKKFTDENEQSLRILTLLGASLLPDVTAMDALAAHLSVMPYLFRWFSMHPSMYRRVFTPFVEAYWNDLFLKKRLGFALPRLVERSLAAATSVPSERRSQAILKAVKWGLPVQVDTEIEEWLKG